MRRVTLLLVVFAVSLSATMTSATASVRLPADPIVIGAQPPPDIRPPKPHSTSGMRMRLSKTTISAGENFSGAAGVFAPGEYVTVWDFYAGNRKVGWLNGGNASGNGVLQLVRTTVSVTAQGLHTLCAKGERTKRVACARYAVKGGALEAGPGATPPSSGGYQPPQTGPGYQAPGSS